MFKLTIKRKDNSIYWVEHFNSQSELNNWLTEERTRPYWDSSFKVATEELKTSFSDEQLQRQKDQQLLASTDWYVVRFMETGVVIPEEISLQRSQARERL